MLREWEDRRAKADEGVGKTQRREKKKNTKKKHTKETVLTVKIPHLHFLPALSSMTK